MGISEVLSENAFNETVKSCSVLKNDLGIKPIVVFGCGNLGKKIFGFLFANKYNVVAWADNNKARWDTELSGIPVLAPAKAGELFGNEALFVVGIWSPGNSYARTKEQLSGLGIKTIMHAAAIMRLFPDELLPHYHFQTPEYFYKHRNEMKEVYDMLADDESKRQYLAHMDCRLSLNFEGLPIADTNNQYFPAGVFKLTDHEVFFDAGAYDGDTLRDFLKHSGGAYEKYIALEPDPKNKEKLENRIKELGATKVEVYPYAVGAENCTLKFDATGGGGAGISNTGDIEVECVRIDDCFYSQEPTYLKFDIEGAELDALAGAAKTIETYKPKMAVCIYHLPDDLWNIPLYLKSRYPFYKLYARTHQFDGLDFVLYAIPE